VRPFWGITLFLAISGIAASAAPKASDDLWDKANQAYAAGRFEEAKVDYLQLVQRRAPTGNLFYNLGNSWFKLGDNGRAILNYKRALVLEPNFPEATANLQVALRAAQTEEHTTVVDLLRSHADLFPLIASTGFWSTLLCVCFWWRGSKLLRSIGKVGLPCFLILFLIGLGFSLWIGHGGKDPDRAIVIEAPADLKFGPANSARTAETLSVGQEVRLISERDEWSLCRAISGTLGWLPTRTIERVLPQ
jgi:tetratricopeptide (TPR) repeat protein